jgi:hypothetical protein
MGSQHSNAPSIGGPSAGILNRLARASPGRLRKRPILSRSSRRESAQIFPMMNARTYIRCHEVHESPVPSFGFRRSFGFRHSSFGFE